MNNHSRLRVALRLNALFSTASAIAIFIYFETIAILMAVDPKILIGVGIGLSAFALQLLITSSRKDRQKLEKKSFHHSVADFIWVIATLVVIILDLVSPTGKLIMAGIAIPVLALGLAQWLALPPKLWRLEYSHDVNVNSALVWAVITDHEEYGRIAPNLSRVEVISGSAVGMQRRCYDKKGAGWNETCTHWKEGEYFAVEVDTSDYPLPLDIMRGEWAVEPLDQNHSRIIMRFEFASKPRMLARLFAAVIKPAFGPVVRKIFLAWEQRLNEPVHSV